MSKKADGLWADYLDNRWIVSNTQTGATLAASVSAPQSAKSSRVLDALSWTVANMNGAGFTFTAHVREVTTGATVTNGAILAQWKIFVPGSTTAHVNPANLNLFAGKGLAMHFTMDTVLGSVAASVNATGWTEQSLDY